MTPLILSLLQGVVILVLAPLATGIVRWAKARLQGRRGASSLLPYIAYATLLKKEMVISPTTSWVFRLAPYAVLMSAVLVALLLPLVSATGAIAAHGDFITVAGVLAIGAVFLVFGGLDSGSAFGGMGSSRDMTLAALVEPSVIAVFAAFAVASGGNDIAVMLSVAGNGLLTHPGLVLSMVALGFVLLAENARYPVDNPATHLELTMVHEAMMIEYSGPYLAMLEYASSLKLAAFSVLFMNFLVPSTLVTSGDGAVAVAFSVAATVVKLAIFMGALALLESSIPKMRFYRMQEYMAVSFLFALGGLAITLI